MHPLVVIAFLAIRPHLSRSPHDFPTFRFRYIISSIVVPMFHRSSSCLCHCPRFMRVTSSDGVHANRHGFTQTTLRRKK